MLQGAVSRRYLHNTHAQRQSVLRRQSRGAVSPHLHHLFPRLLPARRVGGEGQSRGDHPPRPRRLPADGRGDDAPDT